MLETAESEPGPFQLSLGTVSEHCTSLIQMAFRMILDSFVLLTFVSSRWGSHQSATSRLFFFEPIYIPECKPEARTGRSETHYMYETRVCP